MERSLVCGWLILMLMALTPAVYGQAPGQNKVDVDCNGGGPKLSKAIQLAKPGDTITVRGTCREKIKLTVGPLTLDGGGDAVLDGTGLGPGEPEFNGLLTVEAVQGVTIRGLTVRNSQAEGILGLRGASLLIQNTVVENNVTVGIGLSNSVAEVVDSAIRQNGGGIDAFSSSTLIFRGQVDISQNHAGGGLTLNGNSLADIRGGHLKANNNGSFGILVSTHSTLVIFGFQVSQGTQLTTSGNQEQGIVIFNGHFYVAGGTFPPGSVLVTCSTNAGAGMVLAGGSINSPFGAASFVVENNPIGLQFLQGSIALITGGLRVKNNATAGIVADGAVGLTFVSIPQNPSSILSNGTDVILSFGTKSTIDGVTVGTIVCDKTVLSRGTAVCP